MKGRLLAPGKQRPHSWRLRGRIGVPQSFLSPHSSQLGPERMQATTPVFVRNPFVLVYVDIADFGAKPRSCWRSEPSGAHRPRSRAEHSDQASHAATRALILPSPRSCSLAPSVTTSLYRITVSQPLRRNALPGSLYEARSERTSENSVWAKLAESAF